MTRGPRWWIWAAGILLVAVPVLRAAQDRVAHGYPESDDATIALLSQDSLSHDPPLVGMISAGGAGLDDAELHHPGPAELYLIAPFVRYGPGVEPGATVAAVLIALAALAGLVLALHAVGGPRLAAAGLVAAGLVLWGVGSDPAASVWNPYVVILPFASLLALTAASAAGRAWFLPCTLGVASAVAQTHLSYAPLSAGLALWALAAVAWRHRRRLGQVRGPLLTTALVTLAIWTPPLVQQVTGDPGNLAQILRTAQHGRGEAVGRAGIGELGRVVGLPVLGLRPRDGLVALLPPLGLGSAVLAALPVAAAVALIVLARQRGRSDLAAVAATVLVALALGGLTAGRMPMADEVLYRYYGLWMWPLAAIGWLLLGGVAFALWRAVTPAAAGDPDPTGDPEPTGDPGPTGGAVEDQADPADARQASRSRAGAAVPVGALGVGLALLVIGLLPRPRPWEPWRAYRRIAHHVAPDTVDALGGHHRYLVRFRGATAYLSTGSAVVAALDQSDAEVFVDPGAPTPVFPWREFRRYDDEWLDAEVWVVSGARPADLPAAARQVASSPTLTPAEAAGQRARQQRLEAALARRPLRVGPRAAATAAERRAVAAARRDPMAALRSGELSQLASRGLVEPPGGDLQEVVTDARMRGLLQERTVRVYVVPRQRS